ncbi:MAG: ATP-dependent Clp protease proteolytic subunit [Candidatus Pacebacteria bacterium]|jgi:ATP-dependent protease ClpP protease subunit|nr:ATP-dependent Clp protease proteolytic subunit [Candidatus Paceibacterota bacterium]MBP9821756.1 ATP-dependent Clp protease proteolytic subunit [Candidatus Paceibacterota bacterium]
MTKELTQELCIAKRICPLTGRIENGMINDAEKLLFQMCLNDEKRPIRVIIDSGGGNVQPALGFYDFIKGLPCEFEATVVGDCHSAALLILAACIKRKATVHSRFLFHAMRTEVSIFSTKDIRKQLDELERKQTILFQQGLAIQSKAFGISESNLQELMVTGNDFDMRLTAQEALEKGVIHEIVEKFDFFNPAG